MKSPINSKIFLLAIGLGLILLVSFGKLGILSLDFVGLVFGKSWTPDSPLNLVRILGGVALVILVFSFSKKGIINLALLLGVGGLLYEIYLFLNQHLNGNLSDQIHFSLHLLLPLWGIIASILDRRNLKKKA